MNISLCIPVLNEEASIAPLIDSILNGTKIPNEIVFVDGGSIDKTLQEIYIYKNKLLKKNIMLKIVQSKNKGIASDRNLSIKKATGNIIVQIDAGCTARHDFLDKITKPFNKTKIDLVAGFYKMLVDRPIQQAMSVFYGVPQERFDNNFVPSARSVAFRKSVWLEIGGYRENLNKAGEDTDFFYRLIKKGAVVKRVKNAIVYWEVPKNMKESIKKFYNYAKGDAKTGIWWDPIKGIMSHNIKISLIFIRYLIGLLLLIFGFRYSIFHFLLYIFITLYLLYPVAKWHDVVHSLKGRLWLPVVQIVSDFAVMAGFISGIIG